MNGDDGMNGWRLQLRQQTHEPVDASTLRLSELCRMGLEQLKAVSLTCGATSCTLDDLFEITPAADAHSLVFVGDFKAFSGLAANHDGGRFIVIGDVGDYAGAMLRGGELWISGSAGDFLGAPLDSHRTGIRGGRIVVGGDCGRYGGHRMRRGEIVIEGNAGEFLACHQIAGTIIVSGRVGDSCGYAMRRGTLLLSQRPPLCPTRFSEPVVYSSVFFSLFAKQRSPRLPVIEEHRFQCDHSESLIHKIAVCGFEATRGDFAVGGQAELIVPL